MHKKAMVADNMGTGNLTSVASISRDIFLI